MAACGKKGPPLPPLLKVPAPPADFTAERRGDSVDFQFTVPSANTDNTRPANVARVEVYAMTTRDTVSDQQLVKQGTLVATVPVKAPKDPDKTIDEDESPAEMEPPEGKGLDQGAVAHVAEALKADALIAVQPKPESHGPKPPAPPAFQGPLLPVQPAPLARTYLMVGVSTRDRKGPPSKRIAIPLVPPPPAPNAPLVIYDEKAISVTWDRVSARASVQRDPADGELPSKPIGSAPPAVAYNVYDASTNARLTQTPLDDPAFDDPRITWGAERCYTIRAIQTIGSLKIESDAPSAVCTTLTDTFPPAAPGNLSSLPVTGAINLIWDQNAEADLAGYIVLRGNSGATLAPIMNEPIRETTFRDDVQPGIRYVYAVVAVDRAGNRSAPSKSIEDTARE